MKTIKNYTIKNFSNEQNLQILGGNMKLTNSELQAIAIEFNIPKYQIKESEVLDYHTRKFRYFHYALSYGPKSIFWKKAKESKKPSVISVFPIIVDKLIYKIVKYCQGYFALKF